MTPTATPTMITDDERPLWARSTLRRGLPGDGTPRTRAEAQARCRHRVFVHLPVTAPRYRLTREQRAFAVEHAVRTDREAEHVCMGGWSL
jgi:hypothetical protein